MKVDDFFQHHEEISKNGIFLTFSGALTHDFLVKLGDTLKTKMSLHNEDETVMLKVFSLVIEQSQNIIFYSAEKISSPSIENEQMAVGTISVGFKDNHYFVFCGNRISNVQVEKLRGKLEAIQKMNQEELKRYYKEKRRIETDSDSKGAGLGLIEIARKVSQAIEFAFHKLDDNYSYFMLKTVI